MAILSANWGSTPRKSSSVTNLVWNICMTGEEWPVMTSCQEVCLSVRFYLNTIVRSKTSNVFSELQHPSTSLIKLSLLGLQCVLSAPGLQRTTESVSIWWNVIILLLLYEVDGLSKEDHEDKILEAERNKTTMVLKRFSRSCDWDRL